VHGVLVVRQQQALLDDPFSQVELPHRQASLEPELAQVAGAVQLRARADTLLTAQCHLPAIRQTNVLGQVIEHHDPPEGRRQRRDEQAMVLARHHPRDSAGRVAPDAVGDEPFAREQRFVLGGRRASGPRHPPQQLRSARSDGCGRAGGFGHHSLSG
jgi:hypothetical protein